MNTEQLLEVANQAYWVDKQKSDKLYTPEKGNIYYYDDENPKLGKFKVLEIHDNEDGNGMQAMAVAPIDSNTGKVDTSQIVIAYAGTNQADSLDLITDLENVIGGNQTIEVGWIAKYESDGQPISAMNFANKIKEQYGDAVITTTGHSLGEFLALYIAAENHWRNIGFNGPDPFSILSKEAKEWIKNNPGMLINFRNRGDILGNFGGNKTGAGVLISMGMGLTNPLDYHALTKWKFDAKGNLIIPNNAYNEKAIQQQAEKYLMQEFVMGMYALEVLKTKFNASGGGISMNEQIYLDDSQALAVVQYASSEFELVMTNAIKIYKDGINNLEKIWQKTRSNALSNTSELSYHEVMNILSSVGCTEKTMVTIPSELFKQKIDKAKKMSEKFNTLASEIRAKIAELVQRDSDLARQLMS